MKDRRRFTFLVAALALLVLAAALSVSLFLLRPPEPQPPRWPTVLGTLAGVGAPGLAEGCGAQAAFADPFGVAVDAGGTTYVSDAGDNNVIWRVDAGGCAKVLAGGREGFADGDGRDAAFNSPSAIAIDPEGNLVVADTGNHAIRRVTPGGRVTTIAGGGEPGSADGYGTAAAFNGPIGVAVSLDGAVVVADTYNDSIRRIAADGRVTTIAGGGATGYRDGATGQALFDTPSGVALDGTGVIYVADTGNDAVRRIGPDGQVATVGAAPASIGGTLERVQLFRPVGIALAAHRRRDAARGDASDRETRPEVMFVTDATGRVMGLSQAGDLIMAAPAASQAPDAGGRPPLRNPTGIAVAPDGSLRVADSDNYLVRRLTRRGDLVPSSDIDFTPVPWLTAATLNVDALAWPIEPQHQRHELTATLGEARGSLGGDGRERLHTGVDVQAPVGAVVRAARDDKVQRPIAATGFDTANEALRIGAIAYVHVRVGRTASRRMFDAARFPAVTDDLGQPGRVRVRRGTRFRVGDAIGTVNRFAHVHLDVGPRSAEINPLSLPLEGFRDDVAPTILTRGIEFYTEAGERIVPPPRGPVPLSGRVAIVVEAYDRISGGNARRRLGVYRLGYQILREDGTPAPGFEHVRTTIEFDRLPADSRAPHLLYAEGSGITVYGARTTRFRYIVTNELHEGRVAQALLDTSQLAPATYRVRVVAGDWSGNESSGERAILIR